VESEHTEAIHSKKIPLPGGIGVIAKIRPLPKKVRHAMLAQQRCDCIFSLMCSCQHMEAPLLPRDPFADD
jgi:hypothetical protein